MSAEADTLRRRNRELTILNEVATALNGSAGVEGVLEGVLGRVAELLGLQTGWIWLLHEQTGASYLAASRNLPRGLADDPERMDAQSCWCLDAFRRGTLEESATIPVIACSRLAPLETDDSGGLRYHASVPLLSGRRRLGLMNVAGVADTPLPEHDLRLLHTVGELLSIAVERARLYERSERAGAAEERYRLAREVHDTLGQGLTGVLMRLETLEATLQEARAPAAALELTAETLALTRHNLEEARRAVLDLRAAELEGRGLGEALRSLAVARDGDRPAVEVEVIGERPLPLRVESGLFRVAQESVRNAVEHCGGRVVRVQLVLTPETATLSVEDDGRGFDPEVIAAERWGLVGVSERVRLLAGELTIESAPARGTRVRATVPLRGGKP